MKLQVGERYWRRDGALSGTIVPNDSIYFPYRDAATSVSYREDGTAGCVRESSEDLIHLQYEIEEGQDLTPVDTVTISGEEHTKNHELLKAYAKEIENLKEVIKRKNKIMSEIMDIVRDELSKQTGL